MSASNSTPNNPSDQPTTKRCYSGDQCLHPDGPVLPISEFNICRAHKDGLHTYCKLCHRAKTSEWMAKTPNYGQVKLKDDFDYQLPTKKLCASGDECIHPDGPFLPISEFHKAKHHKDNHASYCKKCSKVIASKSKLKNFTRAKEKEYKRGLPHTLTPNDWQRCLDYFNYRCAYCGQPQGLWHFLAKEHFIAASQGGGFTPNNIIPACHALPGAPSDSKFCNNQKFKSPVEEWLISKLGAKKAAAKLEEIRVYFEWAQKQHDLEEQEKTKRKRRSK